jgi:hypothetical protein
MIQMCTLEYKKQSRIIDYTFNASLTLSKKWYKSITTILAF